MVTFTLVPFRLSDNPRERLHVYDVFAETRHRERKSHEGNADRECVRLYRLSPSLSLSLSDNG